MQSKYMKFNNPNGLEGDVSDDATMEQQSWIQAYLSRPESMFYCRVDESYIKDLFNLYDLREKMNIDNSRFRRLIHIITSSRRVEDIAKTYYMSSSSSSNNNNNNYNNEKGVKNKRAKVSHNNDNSHQRRNGSSSSNNNIVPFGNSISLISGKQPRNHSGGNISVDEDNNNNNLNNAVNDNCNVLTNNGKEVQSQKQVSSQEEEINEKSHGTVGMVDDDMDSASCNNSSSIKGGGSIGAGSLAEDDDLVLMNSLKQWVRS